MTTPNQPYPWADADHPPMLRAFDGKRWTVDRRDDRPNAEDITVYIAGLPVPWWQPLTNWRGWRNEQVCHLRRYSPWHPWPTPTRTLPVRPVWTSTLPPGRIKGCLATTSPDICQTYQRQGRDFVGAFIQGWYEVSESKAKSILSDTNCG
jgi:hypothetical protein